MLVSLFNGMVMKKRFVPVSVRRWKLQKLLHCSKFSPNYHPQPNLEQQQIGNFSTGEKISASIKGLDPSGSGSTTLNWCFPKKKLKNWPGQDTHSPHHCPELWHRPRHCSCSPSSWSMPTLLPNIRRDKEPDPLRSHRRWVPVPYLPRPDPKV